MPRLDDPLEPVRPVIVGGSADLPARVAAAHWRRSVAVQRPAAGNYQGRPGQHANGYLPGEPVRADFYGAADMIRTADLATNQSLPYLGDLGIGIDDGTDVPAVRT